jgi:hypothetical protein
LWWEWPLLVETPDIFRRFGREYVIIKGVEVDLCVIAYFLQTGVSEQRVKRIVNNNYLLENLIVEFWLLESCWVVLNVYVVLMVDCWHWA